MAGNLEDPIIPESGGEDEIESVDATDKGKKSSNVKVLQSGKKRQRRLSSSVWTNYDFLDEPDKDGNLVCKCKRCGITYNANSKNGTGNLIRHVKNCKMRTFRDVGQMLLSKSTSSLELRMPKFDADEFRELLAAAIVRHDLPFQFVEYDGIKKCFSYLHPDFKSVTRNTIKADILKMYKRDKEKMRVELGEVSGKISLTSDCWTSITTDGYISLTAHYVDKYWCLQKRIINFCFMAPPHTGVHLSDHVFSLLKEWGIQKKIFSLTLDNASSNDVFAENLRGELDLVCGGDFFHVRCCAHILNLIVQDGLKEIDDAVVKVRETVKYCKGSQARKQRFLSCVKHVELQSGKGLKQDVPTRWNSTFLMLESALYYRKALIHFQKVDANYVHCPSIDEWSRVEKIFRFLKVFYEVTLAFSGTKYPTANLYFPNVLKIRLLLKKELESSDRFMQRMATKMWEKFAKYWSEFNTFMAVAVILDPRFKLQFVEWSFKKIYGEGNDFEEEMNKFRERFYRLYKVYEVVFAAKGKSNATSGHAQFESNSLASDEFMTVSLFLLFFYC
ncbi:putative AC transposase [Bienertia sinuspersici]